MATPVIPTVHRFTREEYHAMGAAGLFATSRVELLEGEVVHMSPKLPPHAVAVTRLMYALVPRLGSAIVRVQDPILLSDVSEPEPDVVVCRKDPGDYIDAHPSPHDIFLVIEVADSSLTYDLTRKLPAYAAAGIPTYWVINLVARRVHVFTAPDPAGRRYREERVAAPGESLTLPDGTLLAVADVLPPA